VTARATPKPTARPTATPRPLKHVKRTKRVYQSWNDGNSGATAFCPKGWKVSSGGHANVPLGDSTSVYEGREDSDDGRQGWTYSLDSSVDSEGQGTVWANCYIWVWV